MKEYAYIVAGHKFTVLNRDVDGVEEALAHYAPFAAGKPDSESAAVFRLLIVPEEDLQEPAGLAEEFRQDDDGSQIRLCSTPDGSSWLEFSLWGRLSGKMLAAPGCNSASLSVRSHTDFALNNALMVLYAMSTARLGTALFHAAAIGFEGRGYLFLGRSGTGKSTHARLWLRHIPGSELVNDDNPVVRVFPDGTVWVYGSPWSGKTPCYRNVELPVGGFVQLEQAKCNEISRLDGIVAYAALVPGISGKRWDRVLADGLHETENALVMRVPVWHLKCLPDEDAARLCAETVSKT